jgi:mannosyltransferase
VPWWRRGQVSLPSVAVPLLALPAGLLMLESLVARPLYVDRYVLYGEAGAALLAGGGAYRIGRWLARAVAPRSAGSGAAGAAGRNALVWVPGIAVCLCVLLLQLGPQHRTRTPQIRLYDFGAPSRYIAAHAHPGDGVLYISDFYRKAELGYPADFRNVRDFALAVSPARAGNFQGADKPLAVIGRLMLGFPRIWVVGRGPQAPLAAATPRAELALLKTHFLLVSTHHYRHVAVSLWLRH